MRRNGRASQDALLSPALVRNNQDKGFHGQSLDAPESDHVRLLFVNIGGLTAKPGCSSRRSCGTCQDCFVRNIVNSTRIDVIGLSEVNVNWKQVPIHHRLRERTNGWFEAIRMATSFHTQTPSKATRLFGGTSLWSVNKMATRVETGLTISDPLGRWSGLGHRGRNGAVLITLVAYRPVVNKVGAESVWSQQSAHYANTQKAAVDPIKQFDADLVQLIQKLLDSNYHIVLGIDANEDLAATHSPFRGKMESAGLQETIMRQHGPGPPTTVTGSTKIDGLFVSHQLRGMRCGYAGYI
jgi:hypothetical protein